MNAPAPAEGRDRSVIDPAGTDIYGAVFRHSNDPLYLLDAATQLFLDVNPAFVQLTGYTRAEIVDGRIAAPALVAPESTETFNLIRATQTSDSTDRYELKILCKSGEKRPVEFSVSRVRLDGRDVAVGSMRDLTLRKRLEQSMREKIGEVAVANSRILALTEKLRCVPELAAQLMNLNEEEELLERAAQILCAREGLDYEQVTFYLLRGDSLEVSYSTEKTRKRRIRMQDDHPLMRVATGLDPGHITFREAVLPLRGPDANLGVIEVAFHAKEMEVLEGNERALKGYHDLLQTLGSLIGQRLMNIQLYETMRIQAILDQTTGVYNRRYFDQKFPNEVRRALRYSRELSLLMIDIDHFKQINDTYGHQAGDLVLLETAKILKTQCRAVDTVCRYGGDEFVILMPETGFDNALAKAEQLRHEVGTKEFENVLDALKPIRATLSLGVTALGGSNVKLEDLLRVADDALFESKRRGRNAVTGRRVDPGPKPPAGPA
jgi:diguanylate cyclase (GGDEF)-like protein/PAS domain S-box-containing protein